MFRLPLLVAFSAALHATVLLWLPCGPSKERAQLPLHVGLVSVTLVASPGGMPQSGEVTPKPVPVLPMQEPPPEPPPPDARPEPVEYRRIERIAVTEAPSSVVVEQPLELPPRVPDKVGPINAVAQAPAPQPAGAAAASMQPQGARTRAHITSRHRPTYPDEARQRGIQGEVMVWLHIGEDGRVLTARVQHSSGHRILDDAAVAFARGLEMRPAREGGRAVASHELLPVYFRLIDP